MTTRYRAVHDDRTLAISIHRSTVEDRIESVSRGLAHDHMIMILIQDIEPIGLTGTSSSAYVVWADGFTSPAWELLDAGITVPELPADAGILISMVLGADGGTFTAVGGVLVAAKVTTMIRTVIERDPRATRGGYQSPKIERLDVTLASGETRVWYAAVVGYSEGYLYALLPTQHDALNALANFDAQLEPVADQHPL